MNQSVLANLQEACPLLAPCVLARIGDEETIELVLRGNLNCSVAHLIQSLQQLGQQRCSSLKSIFLYKEFLSHLSDAEQEQFYETLGQAIGDQIEELSLSFLKLPVRSLACLLQQMPLLNKLYLGRVGLMEKDRGPRLLSALEQLSQLKEFHFSLAPLPMSTNPLFQGENESFDALLLSLARIPSLETIYLAANGGQIRQPACLQALSESSVADLTLMYCPLTTQQHVQALVHRGCRSFASLALINAQIGDQGARVIVEECLEDDSHHSTGLQKLYLPGNQLTDVGANAIAKVLRQDTCQLEVLDLHDNDLTARFGVCMGLSLQQNNPRLVLRFLDVSFNPLKDAGGIALACGLAHNTTLQQLNLFQNQISDQTCVALATALRSNQHLKQLNLYHNPDIKNIDSLLQNLEHENYVLERLELSPHDKRPELDFWLTLNRKFERRNLLSSNMTDGQYLKGLGQAADDLKSLFYFLKAKPSLCQQENFPRTKIKKRPSRSLSLVTAEACSILGDHFE